MRKVSKKSSKMETVNDKKRDAKTVDAETLNNLKVNGVTIGFPYDAYKRDSKTQKYFESKGEDDSVDVPPPIPAVVENLMYGNRPLEVNVNNYIRSDIQTELSLPELVVKFNINLSNYVDKIKSFELNEYFRKTTGDDGFAIFQCGLLEHLENIKKQNEQDEKYAEQIKKAMQVQPSVPQWKKYDKKKKENNEDVDDKNVMEDEEYEYSSDSGEISEEDEDEEPTKTEIKEIQNENIKDFLKKHLVKIQNSEIPNLLEEFENFANGKPFNKDPIETFSNLMSKFSKFDKDVSLLDNELSKHSQLRDGDENTVEMI